MTFKITLSMNWKNIVPTTQNNLTNVTFTRLSVGPWECMKKCIPCREGLLHAVILGFCFSGLRLRNAC